METTEQLITLKDLAKYLNVTERTIYNMIEVKKIPFYRVGVNEGDYRFDLKSVLVCLTKNKIE